MPVRSGPGADRPVVIADADRSHWPLLPSWADRQQAGAWLARWRWDVYLTPTFAIARDHPEAIAREAAAWLRAEAPGSFGWVAVERAPQGGRLHPHLLIGGLVVPWSPARDAERATWASYLAGRWPAGRVRAEAYDRTRGATWYVCKGLLAFALVGEPQVDRGLRRRSRDAGTPDIRRSSKCGDRNV